MRALFLAGSESAWLRGQAQRRAFVRRAVSRFMPGESLDDALRAAAQLRGDGLPAILTHLGENVRDLDEARAVAEHYLEVISRIRAAQLDAEVSVKLTQLGLDLDPRAAAGHLERIAACAETLSGRLWIDMESSPYVEPTLAMYREAHARHRRLGVAIQAYLHRSAADVETLVAEGAALRIVKGAYREPATVAMARKADVDESFFRLCARVLMPDARARGAWLTAGTHDEALIERLRAHAGAQDVPQDAYEFAMLYGIRRAAQLRLARSGATCRVLVSYGAFWFPWYMRRLAERPANAWFVVRSLVQS